MSQYDPNLDPTRQPAQPRSEPIYSETIVVRRESNTGWWIAGGLAALVLLAVIWILASRGGADESAVDAQAQASVAAVQGQITGAQQSVDIARAEAARAQAEAIRSASDARAAEARASTAPAPVIITAAPAPAGSSTITTNAPQ